MLDYKFMVRTFFMAARGIPTTLALTFITLLISSIPAFFMARSKINKKRVSSKIVSIYISFIRGTPVVLQILFLYSLLPTLLNYFFKEILHSNINIFDINPLFYAYIVFTLNTTAVLSEVFRSALLTVDSGQMEAALSSGLTTGQAYIRIILPQAFVSALPNISNAAINLLKSTSLAFMMTVKDITAIAKTEAAFGYNYIEAYLDILVLYIILCTVIQLAFRFTEKQFSIYKRKK